MTVSYVYSNMKPFSLHGRVIRKIQLRDYVPRDGVRRNRLRTRSIGGGLVLKVLHFQVLLPESYLISKMDLREL